MDDIRIPLLGLGLLLIAGVYIWSRTLGFHRRRRNRRMPAFGGSGTRSGDAGASPAADRLDTDVPSLHIDDAPAPDAEAEGPPPLEPVTGEADLPASRRGRGQKQDAVSKGPVQVEFAFDPPDTDTDTTREDETVAKAPPRMPASAGPAEEGSAEQEILPLYICAGEGHSYHGRDILRAVNDVGMNFGEMNIFQHYGIGDLASDTALFNMANMLEPGSFDLSHIDEFETTGLALFMALPGPADPLLVFELMLNTAERLVQHLGGEIRDQHHHVMDAAAIDRLRQRAAARR